MCLKFNLSPYKIFWTQNIASHQFCSLSLNVIKRGKAERHKIVQIVGFPIILGTGCLKNMQYFMCGILQLLILNQIEGMHLPITSLL